MGEARQPLIVVSNTSPLTNLAAIGQFDLLQAIFGHLHISDAVTAELSSGGRAWPGAMETENSPWIAVHTIHERHTVDALRLELDIGEAETIVLALQLGADLVLMDEQDSALSGPDLGLDVMGVVGLRVGAKRRATCASRSTAAREPRVTKT